MRYQRRMVSRNNGPDMTAMLDVVFILLIFFIVTASFVKESGLSLNLPKGKGPKQPDSPIAFRIDSTNRIFHDKRLIDPWLVEAIIKGAHTVRPDVPVLIATDPDAHTGQVIRLHDQARKAGMPADRIAVLVL